MDRAQKLCIEDKSKHHHHTNLPTFTRQSIRSSQQRGLLVESMSVVGYQACRDEDGVASEKDG
jgi:hypothetical protein